MRPDVGALRIGEFAPAAWDVSPELLRAWERRLSDLDRAMEALASLTAGRRRAGRLKVFQSTGSRNRLVEPIMEAAGIEPASADAPERASTSVVPDSVSPAGRFRDDTPDGLAIL